MSQNQNIAHGSSREFSQKLNETKLDTSYTAFFPYKSMCMESMLLITTHSLDLDQWPEVVSRMSPYHEALLSSNMYHI